MISLRESPKKRKELPEALNENGKSRLSLFLGLLQQLLYGLIIFAPEALLLILLLQVLGDTYFPFFDKEKRLWKNQSLLTLPLPERAKRKMKQPDLMWFSLVHPSSGC